jgi:ATP-dependent Clp protease ATP-binding subunit ClpB
LDVKSSAIKFILAAGYDPVYGARPLRRYLEKNIVTPISRILISGDLDDHATVHVEEQSGKLVFSVTPDVSTQPKKKVKTQMPSSN